MVDTRREIVFTPQAYRLLPSDPRDGSVYIQYGLNRGPSWEKLLVRHVRRRPLRGYVEFEEAVHRHFEGPPNVINGMGFPLNLLFSGAWAEPDRRYLQFLDRPYRLFLEEEQNSLSHLEVGLVGFGKTGSAVFSNLLSQGVRHYVLVEQADEIIEPANVALMTGVTMDDVGRHKLDIADRMAQSLPGVHLAKIKEDVRSPRVLERLKGVDILVCAVDDAFVPIVLNRLSVQYFIPLVSSGLMMERTEDGPVLRGQVHVTIPSVQLNMVEGNRRPTCCHACIDAFNLLQASYDAMAAVEREAALRRGYVPRRGVGPGFGVLSRTAASVISWTVQNIVAGFTGYYPRILFDLGGEHFDSGHGLPSFAYADPGLTVSEDCLVCGRSGVLGLGDEEPLRDWRPERHNYRLPRLPGLGPRR